MTKIYIGVGLFILLSAWGWYTKSLIEDKAVYEVELNNTVATLRDYSLRTEAEVDAYRQGLESLQKGYVNAQDRADELSEKLAKHDLSALFKSKPELVERRINDGTRKLLDTIRSVTRPPDSGVAESDKATTDKAL